MATHDAFLLIDECVAYCQTSHDPRLFHSCSACNVLLHCDSASLHHPITTRSPCSKVFLLACHLLYWGKARVIYPLCMSNEYVLSPTASLSVASPLTEEFAAHFPHHYLHSVLALFSVPCQLWDMQCLEDFSQVAPPICYLSLLFEMGGWWNGLIAVLRLSVEDAFGEGNVALPTRLTVVCNIDHSCLYLLALDCRWWLGCLLCFRWR